MKLAKSCMWLVLVALTACSPDTAIGPSPAPTLVPATATHLPTNTPLPAPTASLRPTATAIAGKFDVGGVKLSMTCMGQGSPTVVLDSGWGTDSRNWSAVMLKVRAQTRVCSYDRAGLGQSEGQPGLRTSGQLAEQLHTLLAKAGVESPYVLVGHSLGGLNMLVFADRYRSEVTGVVLVDSAHPDQVDQFVAALPMPAPNEAQSLAALRKQIGVGVWANPDDANYPEPMNWAETLSQARAVKSLGTIPLAVVVAVDSTKSPWKDAPPEVTAKLDQVWLDLHRAYLSLSTASLLIRAEHSGHFIQTDEPQIVIDAILNLVDTAR